MFQTSWRRPCSSSKTGVLGKQEDGRRKNRNCECGQNNLGGICIVNVGRKIIHDMIEFVVIRFFLPSVESSSVDSP